MVHTLMGGHWCWERRTSLQSAFQFILKVLFRGHVSLWAVKVLPLWHGETLLCAGGYRHACTVKQKRAFTTVLLQRWTCTRHKCHWSIKIFLWLELKSLAQIMTNPQNKKYSTNFWPYGALSHDDTNKSKHESRPQLQPITASHSLRWILSLGHEVNDFVLCQIRFIFWAWINLSALCVPLRHYQAKP